MSETIQWPDDEYASVDNKLRFSVAEDFSFLSPALDNLPTNIKNQLAEIVYCWRDGVESVIVVTESLDCFQTLLKDNVPTEMLEAKVYSRYPRYGVDLESIGTDNVRMYTDDEQRADISAISYKFNSDGNLTEKKDFWRHRVGDQKNALIDTYDASNNLTFFKRPLTVLTKSDFLGSSELVDKIEQVANTKRYSLAFFNIASSNHSYIRIRRKHVMLKAHIEAMRK